VAAGRDRARDLAEAADRSEPRIAVNLFVSVDSEVDAAREVVRDGLGHRFQTEAGMFESSIAGTPGEVRDRMLEYVGVGCSAFDLKILPLATDATLRQMELLAREVLPALSGR
jgi:alkanesulfonate monooxygenase SsuD/methylene tetrahydromethanopterin reductase-like flavin-dependent oxidoreductase (luciferase family)